MQTCLAARGFNQKACVDRMASEITNFGRIVESLLDRLGWTQEQLSTASEPNISQGQISNYKYGKRSPSRETIRTISRAFTTGANAGESFYRSTVNELLTACGYAEDFPSNDEYDEHEVIDYLRGRPAPLQDKALRMLKAMFDEDDAIDNAGNIGKRAK